MQTAPDISRAIIEVLKECSGRPLATRALATYVNAFLAAPADIGQIRRCLEDLEQRGYLRRALADRLDPASLQWELTPSGRII